MIREVLGGDDRSPCYTRCLMKFEINWNHFVLFIRVCYQLQPPPPLEKCNDDFENPFLIAPKRSKLHIEVRVRIIKKSFTNYCRIPGNCIEIYIYLDVTTTWLCMYIVNQGSRKLEIILPLLLSISLMFAFYIYI